ncbi:MAG: translation initiation factor IF-2 [Anaerolineae bacterium]|nr:translation initiation factor IF-2 [Anaerolineae bacterium]MCB0204475.1 translation initiation factor IF-2 [Anaerolineae bacterium]
MAEKTKSSPEQKSGTGPSGNGNQSQQKKSSGSSQDGSANKSRPRGQNSRGRRRPTARRTAPPGGRPPGGPPRRTEAAPPPSEIELPEYVTVREMAEIMHRSPIDVMKVLMNFGIMAPITQTIDYDTAAIVAEEMGVKVNPIAPEEPEEVEETVEEKAAPKTLRQRLYDATPDERLVLRPPVVTVLGHVDHGKTTLLDAIRKSNVVAGESGGITQHIGAYQAFYHDRKITFLDTPGHQAFTAMRARGAQATDIAILVVAADDGVMPQTREAIAHVQAAGVPIIVALNKVDKANANIDRVKQQLADEGLLVEEYGGDVICVPVAAKLRQGIDDLLEHVLLLADIEGFKADPTGRAIGTIIESSLDKSRGATATLLVQKGTLKQGDALVVGSIAGRVRAMFDSKGHTIVSATPSTPVEILGLPEVPTAGDTFEVMESDREARERATARAESERQRTESSARKSVSLEDVFAQMKAGQVKELRIIIKADVDGSLEPIISSLNQLSNDELRLKILHSGTGDITDSDLMLASASDAIVIGFNVPLSPAAQHSDLLNEVDVRTYKVIYELIDDVDKALKGMLEPVYEDEVLGTAEIRAIFRIPRRGNIAGCLVTDGVIQRNALVRVGRNGKILFSGKIHSLKRFQEDVNEVKAGFECGIGIEGFDDIAEGDIIEAFHKVRV